MAKVSRFFSSFLFLLLHLGCFIFTSSSSKKRKFPAADHSQAPAASRLRITPSKALSSSWSFIKRVFIKPTTPLPASASPHVTLSPSSSVRSVAHPVASSPDPLLRVAAESDISSDQHFFPLRNDIYPCPACGEIFHSPSELENHRSLKHAVSELIDGDSGKNIVGIIFKSGWPGSGKAPEVYRIMKIHCSPRILSRFEEYRESVMSRASRGGGGGSRRRDERCAADGNELLRFHCTTFTCELGKNGGSTLCGQEYCSACGIIRTGFSPKMDGIATQSTSWRAHLSIPEDIEEDFGFMHVKRAVLICRVIAGRVGSDHDDGHFLVDKPDPGFDSLVGRRGGVHARLDEEDELVVFRARLSVIFVEGQCGVLIFFNEKNIKMS